MDYLFGIMFNYKDLNNMYCMGRLYVLSVKISKRRNKNILKTRKYREKKERKIRSKNMNKLDLPSFDFMKKMGLIKIPLPPI